MSTQQEELWMLNKNWQQAAKEVSKAIAKCWLNPQFKTRFVNDPQDTLAELGVNFGENVIVKVEEGAVAWKIEPPSPLACKAIITIGLPLKPADITDEELHRWTNGKTDTKPSPLPNSC